MRISHFQMFSTANMHDGIVAKRPLDQPPTLGMLATVDADMNS
jgi:hypothetical protein